VVSMVNLWINLENWSRPIKSSDTIKICIFLFYFLLFYSWFLWCCYSFYTKKSHIFVYCNKLLIPRCKLTETYCRSCFILIFFFPKTLPKTTQKNELPTSKYMSKFDQCCFFFAQKFSDAHTVIKPLMY
jgi:hypothetical protein